jgi:hypothetical protein
MFIMLVVFLCVLLSLCFVCWPRAPENLNVSLTVANNHPSIFVILPSLTDPAILDQIFSSAAQPLRIFVGVGSVCPSQPNVRNLTQNQPFGNSIARQEIFKHLSRSEHFTLSVGSDCEFASHWDETLLHLIKDQVVITQWPLSHGSSSSYPIFDQFVNKVPKFNAFPAASIHSFRLHLATFDCFFGKTSFIKDCFRLGLPYENDCESDLLLTWFLAQKQAIIYTPGKAIVHMQHTKQPMNLPYYKELRLFTQFVMNQMLLGEKDMIDPIPLYLLEDTPIDKSFYEELGIQIDEQTVAGRTRLGLLNPNYTDQDIYDRFGTKTLFQQFKQRVSSFG